MRPGRRFLRQFASLSFANAVAAGASFVVLAILARTVDLATFGEVVFAQTVAGIIFALADPRLEHVVVRYLPIAERDEGAGSGTWLYETALFGDTLIGVAVGAAAVVLIASGLLPLESPADPTLLALAMVQWGALAAFGTAVAGWVVTDGLVRMGFLQAGLAVATSAAAVAGVLLWGAEGYLAALCLGAAVTSTVLAILGVHRVRRRYGAPRPLRLRGLAGIGGFTLKSSLAASAEIGTDLVPSLIIGSVGGPSVLAQYRVAQSPGRFVAMGYSPYAIIVLGPMSQDSAAGRPAEIRRRAFVWTAAAFPALLLGAAFAYLTLPFLVPFVFGDKFEPAVAAAVLLTIGAGLRATVAWSKVLPLAVGRPGVRLGVIVAEGLLMLAVTAALADRGATAVAAGYLAVSAAVTVTWIAVALRLTRGGAAPTMAPVEALHLPPPSPGEI